MRTILLSTAFALLAAGCAQPPVAEPVVAPNPNLVAQGIPPVPQSLADRVAKYTDFRGHGFVEWHPTKREMLVNHRKAGDTLVQLYRLSAPMAEPEQLTADNEPVYQASYEPREGRYLVFERSSGGNEAAQIHRLDLDTRKVTLISNPAERHNMLGWLRKSGQLLYSSVPLDRNSAAARTGLTTRISLVDPARPEGLRAVAELPGGGWFGGPVSPYEKLLGLVRYVSATESEIWTLDIASGQRRKLLPADGDGTKASYYVADFAPDGRSLYFRSTRSGEFLELMQLDLASGAIARLSSSIPWDLEQPTLSHDGRLIAAAANVDGREELRLFDAATRQPLAAPDAPRGSIGAPAFHPARNELAFAVNNAKGPCQVWTFDPATGRSQQWTKPSAAPGVDMAAFSEQQVIRWTSFDGRTISGLISRPPARFTGKRPVLIDIHGGPEGQATVGFLGRYNYFVQELGVVMIQPNVRGSTGFGKTFLSLDDGMKREDSVKDIGALLDWIAKQPDLDASRVAVSGGSYGGYMSLAVSTHYADRIAGAVDDVGISHFVTFLNNTESYRRDLRRSEYGDERDPAMRAFLDRISPLSNAQRIKKPLFVVQGKNDPRVPYTEAEQIVEKVRANGVPVWYLRAENEGHGFVRKENADFRFFAMVKFLENVLLR